MDEFEPVGDDEFVYRRIHICYFKEDLRNAIQLAAVADPSDDENTA